MSSGGSFLGMGDRGSHGSWMVKDGEEEEDEMMGSFVWGFAV